MVADDDDDDHDDDDDDVSNGFSLAVDAAVTRSQASAASPHLINFFDGQSAAGFLQFTITMCRASKPMQKVEYNIRVFA